MKTKTQAKSVCETCGKELDYGRHCPISCKTQYESPTQERLIEDLKNSVSRYLDLFRSDSERLKAAQILAELLVNREAAQ